MTDIFTFSLDDGERYADILAETAGAIVRGEAVRAEAILEPIAGERWMGRIAGARRTASEPFREKIKRPSIPDRVATEVFARDRFRCTYCGGRVVPRHVLVAFSDAFPTAIPYHRHYKSGMIHPAYWGLVPEADHVIAHSRGGATSSENLTTLHTACNAMKSDVPVELLPPLARRGNAAHETWDGLVSRYRSIVELGDRQGTRHSTPSYHQRWLRLYEAQVNSALVEHRAGRKE